MSKAKTILVGVTGSIAAYKAGDLIRRLKERSYAVSVVMTQEAEKFISPLTLASLCGQKVYRDLFEDDQSAGPPANSTDDRRAGMPHIALAEQADVFLIAPATAHVIGKIAGGLADDLLSCIALATRAPIIMAPAMNDGMYQNRIVQQNIRKLKSLGIKFVEPTQGSLACGTFGEGHLAEIEDILKAVDEAVYSPG